jgi:hypothetical protein
MKKDQKEIQEQNFLRKKELLFLNDNEISKEQLFDPDYRLKILIRDYNNYKPLYCSKCHHCR